MELYLDGVDFLECKVIEKQLDSTSRVVREGWIRLSMPIHVALTCIRTVCCQAIRGTTTIFVGIFTLRGKKIVAGLKDYLSLLIQAVALPAIGIVATFHPKTGLTLARKLTKYHQKYEETSSTSTYVKIVESFFRGIGGVPSIFVIHSTKSISFALRGRVKRGVANMLGAIILPFFSFAGIFAGGWVNYLYNGVHEACGVKKTNLPPVHTSQPPERIVSNKDPLND